MLKLEIFLDPADGDLSTSLAAHMAALGFVPASYAKSGGDPWNKEWSAPKETGVNVVDLSKIVPESAPAPVSESAPVATAAQPEQEQPARRRRRTKEEIERDNAAAAAAEPVQQTSLISTGEPRVDPAIAAQDAADEAAEKTSTTPTIEDVRAAVGRYSQKFGVARATKDMPAILGCGILEIPDSPDAYAAAVARIDKAIAGETPAADPAPAANAQPEPFATKADVIAAFQAYGMKYDGADVLKSPEKCPNVMKDGPALLEQSVGVKAIPSIPDNPDSYAKAVAAIRKAIAENPFKREARS